MQHRFSLALLFLAADYPEPRPKPQGFRIDQVQGKQKHKTLSALRKQGTTKKIQIFSFFVSGIPSFKTQHLTRLDFLSCILYLASYIFPAPFPTLDLSKKYDIFLVCRI
ncbi:MAG: hypothetical protein JW928_06280 [Candidatus Aureabacteria bacterium]|nr:hypothetical protein [Candidatus Auribacterota bacterium]